MTGSSEYSRLRVIYQEMGTMGESVLKGSQYNCAGRLYCGVAEVYGNSRVKRRSSVRGIMGHLYLHIIFRVYVFQYL